MQERSTYKSVEAVIDQFGVKGDIFAQRVTDMAKYTDDYQAQVKANGKEAIKWFKEQQKKEENDAQQVV